MVPIFAVAGANWAALVVAAGLTLFLFVAVLAPERFR